MVDITLSPRLADCDIGSVQLESVRFLLEEMNLMSLELFDVIVTFYEANGFIITLAAQRFYISY